MKTKFICELGRYISGHNINIEIIGKVPENDPYVVIHVNTYDIHIDAWIPDKDLERFAVNILKALGSKKLKQ
jgi:hypothetical protein